VIIVLLQKYARNCARSRRLNYLWRLSVCKGQIVLLQQDSRKILQLQSERKIYSGFLLLIVMISITY